ATNCRTRCRRKGIASALIVRLATSWPAWRTSCVACWRTQRTSPSSVSGPVELRWASCCKRHDRAAAGRAAASARPERPPFATEPALELRRASERAALLAALGELDAAGPVRAPV